MTSPGPAAAAGVLLARAALALAAFEDRAFALHAARMIDVGRHDIRAIFARGPDGAPVARSLRYSVAVPALGDAGDMVPLVTVPWQLLPMRWSDVLDELADCQRWRASHGDTSEPW